MVPLSKLKNVLCTGLVFLLLPKLVLAFPAKFAIGPDNNQSLVLETIQSAKKTLDINIYQLDNATVVNAILEKINSGIVLNLLIEGHPVGGINPAGKAAIDRIKTAMIHANANHSRSRSHLYLMTGKTKNDRRYRFDHAKYMIIDSEKTLVSSENLTQGGHPNPGNKGSRGWDVVLEDVSFAKELSDVFQIDVSFKNDILDLTEKQSYNVKGPDNSNDTNLTAPDVASPTDLSQQSVKGSGEVRGTTLITSPNSLNGLVDMIAAAKKTIDVETMTLPLTWQVGRELNVEQNPILTALIDAAQRGVQVKLLLNDDGVFSKPGNIDSTSTDTISKSSAPRNIQTRDFVEKLKFCKNLSISSEIIDVNKAGISYIHNKGFIIDQKKVLVSSINGTHNSVTNNREVAVLLESEDAARYFGKTFSSDWEKVLPQSKTPIDCSTLTPL